jgi:hypothetical protein
VPKLATALAAVDISAQGRAERHAGPLVQQPGQAGLLGQLQ